MKRWAVNLAAAVSLALSLAMAALWMRSSATGPPIAFKRVWAVVDPPACVQDDIELVGGALRVSRLRCSYGGPPAAVSAHVDNLVARFDGGWQRNNRPPASGAAALWLPSAGRQTLGFPENPAPSVSERGVLTTIVLPLWVLTGVTAALPTLWLRRALRGRRARQRQRLGLCPT